MKHDDRVDIASAIIAGILFTLLFVGLAVHHILSL